MIQPKAIEIQSPKKLSQIVNKLCKSAVCYDFISCFHNSVHSIFQVFQHVTIFLPKNHDVDFLAQILGSFLSLLVLKLNGDLFSKNRVFSKP